MKYLPVRELAQVTSALNFRTPDCRVVGGCDLYITKAVGSDKKLYKSIEQSLESQHESLIRLAESFTPPKNQSLSVNLNRSSAFGDLGKVSSRRTFAYLIATLNASHPDYEFSHFLRPSDFQRERVLTKVMATVDETLYNLRPRPTGALLAAPANSTYPTGPPQTPGGTTYWSARMWKTIDRDMALRECEIYRYNPEEDPFDGDESAIWSMNYFFFNKERRRVLYIHVRGLSASSRYSKSPGAHGSLAASYSKRARTVSRSLSFSKTGASKRARFWLGDKADRCMSEPVWGEDDAADDDGNSFVIAEPGDDDEMDVEEQEEDEGVEFEEDVAVSESDAEADEAERRWRSSSPRSPVRAMSESIAEEIEV